MTSSIFEPVSIKAVARIVNEPLSSVFLAAPKNLLGLCNAFASIPPERIFPEAGATVLLHKSNAGDQKRVKLDDTEYLLIRESEIVMFK